MFTTPDSRAALILLMVLVASPFAYGIRFIKIMKEWSRLNDSERSAEQVED